MSRKSRTEAATPNAAPPADEALQALFRRNVRAVVFLLVRLVAIALLTSLLALQFPGIGRYRFLADAAGGLLVLWPFFTAVGRTFAWRIALGRAYAREGRWDEAARTLYPFIRQSRQLFDATGEGTFWLAVALRHLGRGDQARRLFGSVAASRRGEWSEKAAAEARASP